MEFSSSQGDCARMPRTISLTLNDTQAAMLATWRAAQPMELSEAEAAKALMVAGLLLVHGDFTRDGSVGALWTGAGPPGLH